MKQIQLIILFVLMNALFIFLLVHKQSQIIQLRYKIQRLEGEEKELLKKEEQLLYILQKQQDLKKVKDYALNDLEMEPIKLKDVKKYGDL
jgi:hypothetical protein